MVDNLGRVCYSRTIIFHLWKLRERETMKKILAIVLAVMMLLSMAACGEKKTEKDTYVVGICQLVQHDALDAATEGFMQALKDELGDKVTFDLQNASGEVNNCTSITNKFVSQDVDLIMANATPALQAAVNSTLDIPVLGTSVTEYGVALQLENFNGTVGGNVSGTSDLAPLDQQAAMVKEWFPNAKNVGLLYCSAEANSKYQVEVIKKELTTMGYTCNEYSFSDSNDVQAVAQKAAAESDVIYVPTDNTAASSAEIIRNVCTEGEKKVPVIAGEENICKGCGVATLSISYYDLGYTTGKMAAKILTGEADISTMEIAYAENFTKKYNKELCEELGLTPPEGYEAIA